MDKQRYALITGANGGIGQALCQIFSEGGYRVVATDRQREAAPGLVCVHYLSADLVALVNDEVYANGFLIQVRNLCADGVLQSLVNNAAIQILGGVDSLSRDDWSTTLDINLLAPFLLVQGLLPELEAAQGAVVNISSIHAKLTKRNFVAYATSKAALSGMTRAMAVDLGSRVRVNAIEPAAVNTAMLKAGFLNDSSGYNNLSSSHPAGRIAEPIELANFALFLSSNNSRFTHGSVVSISGGIEQQLHEIN